MEGRERKRERRETPPKSVARLFSPQRSLGPTKKRMLFFFFSFSRRLLFFNSLLMPRTTGFPRIGPNREMKKALER